MWQKPFHPSLYVTGKTNDPDLPDILLVHGAGGTGDIMMPLLTALDTFSNVLALHLPGRNNPAAALDTIGELAAFLGGFVMAGSAKKPWVAGHSLGGAIALEAAGKWPELFSGLILLHTSTQMPLSEAFMTRLSGDWIKTMDRFLRKAYGPHAGSKLVEDGIALTCGLPENTVLNDFRACRTYNAMGYLKKIALPVLVVAGAEDDITRLDEARLLKDHLENSKLLILPHSGHMGHLVMPDVEADEIRKFINNRLKN